MSGRLRRTEPLKQLSTLYNIGTISDLTDGQLLERLATDSGEVAELAFAALGRAARGDGVASLPCNRQ